MLVFRWCYARCYRLILHPETLCLSYKMESWLYRTVHMFCIQICVKECIINVLCVLCVYIHIYTFLYSFHLKVLAFESCPMIRLSRHGNASFRPVCPTSVLLFLLSLLLGFLSFSLWWARATPSQSHCQRKLSSLPHSDNSLIYDFSPSWKPCGHPSSTANNQSVTSKSSWWDLCTSFILASIDILETSHPDS